MTLLHTMSFAGSIAIGIYILTYFLSKRYLPISWHKTYLTINIILFFVPFGYFKSEYTGLINKFFGHETWYQKNSIVKNMIDNTVFVYQDGVYMLNWLIYIVLLISIVLGAGGLALWIMKYCNVYRNIMKGVIRFEQGDAIIDKLLKESRRPKKIKVYLCVGLKTPVTMGIIRGKIILPAVEWEENRLTDALHHELVHIFVRDNLVKTILVAAVILNFYNPLVYYLLYRWKAVAELYCDYKVTKDKSAREIIEYVNLLIDFAELQGTGSLPITGLNIGKKQLKERIKYMKNTSKKFGTISKMAGVFIIAAAIFLSSLTAYAYEERQIEYFNENSYEAVDNFYFYSDGEDSLTELDLKYDEYEKYVTADDILFFVSDTGEVYYDVYTESEQTYLFCNHTYVSGTITNHVKNDTGGCKTDYYDGKVCNKCGHVVRGDYIRTISYAVCPH